MEDPTEVGRLRQHLAELVTHYGEQAVAEAAASALASRRLVMTTTSPRSAHLSSRGYAQCGFGFDDAVDTFTEDALSASGRYQRGLLELVWVRRTVIEHAVQVVTDGPETRVVPPGPEGPEGAG